MTTKSVKLIVEMRWWLENSENANYSEDYQVTTLFEWAFIHNEPLNNMRGDIEKLRLEEKKPRVSAWGLIQRQRGEHIHMSPYALVCRRKGQRGQHWHAIIWAHGAAAGARPGVLHFPQRPPPRWPVSARCHPDYTSCQYAETSPFTDRQQTKEDGWPLLCSQSWK